jgi:hypothetical protein
MKTFILLCLLCISGLLQAQTNDLLPEKLIISYPVLFSDNTAELNYRFQNSLVVENEHHNKEFIGISLTKKAVQNELTVYDPYINRYYPYSVFDTEVINLNELKERLGYQTDTLINWTEDPDNQSEITSKAIDYTEIRSLYFTEAWNFDSEALVFEKDIIAISPIREYYRESGFEDESKRFAKAFRSLYPDDLGFFKKRRSEKNMEVRNTIVYECLLVDNEQFFYDIVNIEVSNAPFLTSHSRKKLFRGLIEPVLSGKLKAYSYPDEESLSVNQVEKALGLSTDTVYSVDPDTGETIILLTEQILDYNQFKSILFFEDWYYDPKTTRMKKEVKALAPVRHYYSEEDYDMENPIKQIVFKVYLK